MKHNTNKDEVPKDNTSQHLGNTHHQNAGSSLNPSSLVTFKEQVNLYYNCGIQTFPNSSSNDVALAGKGHSFSFVLKAHILSRAAKARHILCDIQMHANIQQKVHIIIKKLINNLQYLITGYRYPK